MSKFCVFAGTAEGRMLVEFLCARGAEVTACVATEYGGTLLPASERLRVSARPLPEEEIRGIYDAALAAIGDRTKIAIEVARGGRPAALVLDYAEDTEKEDE